MVPGNRVYRERLALKDGTEYRVWDPFRSKLAAAILSELDYFPFRNRSRVLYLGASTGTTVSHISDIVGPSGIVFAVDHASRTSRDLLDRVVAYRKNVIPVLQDARYPKEYFTVFGKVDVVYADIAQPDQTEIAAYNCEVFLKEGGHLFMVVKTPSIDAKKSPGRIVAEETKKLLDRFDILQTVDLEFFDRQHSMVIARLRRRP